MRCLVLITLLLSFSCFTGIGQPRDLYSPDRNINILVDVSEKGEIIGTVSYKNARILYLRFVDFSFEGTQTHLCENLEIIKSETVSFDSVWEPVLRRFSTVRDMGNEMSLDIKEKVAPGRHVNLKIRAYNDGIAFRTEFLGPDINMDYSITEENTSFIFAGNYTCWVANHKQFNSPQESMFLPYKIEDLSDEMLIGLPVTVKTDTDCFFAITEADLTDYAGMYLKKNPENKSRLDCTLSAYGDRSGAKVLRKLPFCTPWRTMIIGEEPGDLIESEMICNLSRPSKISDCSWIQPGISAWDNWYSYDVKMEQETIKKFIDFASEMGWQYMTIDWQWYGEYNHDKADITKWSESINLPELIKYAKSKDIRIILWLYWTDVQRSDWDQVCYLYNLWGIAGVKIDFMDRDDQEMVNWYESVLETAARHNLIVNFHGAYKPTGLRRTFPNLLTREGVLGNEWNRWSSMVTPEHLCTLPFTRMLAGPMDFTPGSFVNRNYEDFKIDKPTQTMVSRCNSLAQFVIFDSPLTVACDHPDNYRNKAGISFLRSLPTVWDRTVVVNGQIGEYITMARKSGARWYLAAMNNSSKREIVTVLDFLEKGEYKMTVYRDDTVSMDYESAIKEEMVVSKGDSVHLKMVPGGGYAAIIEPVNNN